MALKRMGFDERMCGHGFRSLALTNIQEKLKIDLYHQLVGLKFTVKHIEFESKTKNLIIENI